MINFSESVNSSWGAYQQDYFYELETACLNGNVNQLNVLLHQQQVKLKHLSDTLLIVAVAANHIHMVDYLLSLGADPCYFDELGIPAILKAFSQNDLFLIDKLFEQINLVELSPRAVSCLIKFPSLIPLFVKKGLALKSETSSEFHPLRHLCMKGEIDHIRAIFNDLSLSSVRLIIAEACLMQSAIMANKQELLDLLIEFSQDIDFKDLYQATPLMRAAEYSLDFMRFLLEKGASIHQIDKLGNTALFYACRGGNVEAVRELIERGCPINSINFQNQTPLTIASLSDKKEVIIFLLEKLKVLKESKKNNDNKENPAKRNKNIIAQKLIAHAWSLKGFFEISGDSIRYEGFYSPEMRRIFKDIVRYFFKFKTLSDIFSPQNIFPVSPILKTIPLRDPFFRESESSSFDDELDSYSPKTKKQFSVSEESSRIASPWHTFPPLQPNEESHESIIRRNVDLFIENMNEVGSTNFEEVIEKIKKNLPVYLPSGWSHKMEESHSTGILFFNGVHKINRGEGSDPDYSSIAYTYDKDRLTLQVVRNILDGAGSCKFWSKHYFLKGIDHELALKRISFSCAKQKKQKVGSCSWSTLQGAFFTFLQLIAEKNYIPQESVKRLYKAWNQFADEWVILVYLKSDLDINHQLLIDVYMKAIEKPTRNVNVIRFLENYFSSSFTQEVVGNDQFPPRALMS